MAAFGLILTLAVLARPSSIEAAVVHEVTRLYPVIVERVARPKTVEEVQWLVKNHSGPISIGGGRFSMGGQTATEGALQIDMRGMNRILKIDIENKILNVEAGATWRHIQESIDKHDLSLKIMQSYANFTVGGSLSVNAHGRYVNQGPIVHAVRRIKIVLADGTLKEASRTLNPDLFNAAIGGYGGVGVIVSAELDLEKNEPLERTAEKMPLKDYVRWFKANIKDSKTAVFHNADIYPPDYDGVLALTYAKTDRKLTVQDRLQRPEKSHRFTHFMQFWLTKRDYAKRLRETALDPVRMKNKPVVWRNYEASYDVKELEPRSRRRSTYVLQEYFIPVDRLEEFTPKMAEIFRRHKANVLNVSIRHAVKDPWSILAWARQEVFAFVVYYEQGTERHEQTAVGIWTRELVDAAVAAGGTYYLPYQWHPSEEQFHKAYPRAKEFFALKKRLDPSYKFRNLLWDRYLPPPAKKTAVEEKVLAKLENRRDWKRAEEQSLLTLPEWFIVYSADEMAAHLKSGKPPGAFHFKSSIKQFWAMRKAVNQRLRGLYPRNVGYQAMIFVIGASYSVELALKGLYEKTFGRMALALSKPGRADEALAHIADKYALFLYDTPWYEFPFRAEGRRFSQTIESQPFSLRKLERRLSGCLELSVKAVYAKIIRKATGAAYAPEDLTLRAWVRGDAVRIAKIPDVKILEKLEDGGLLIEMARYRKFQAAAAALAKAGVRFVQIAGNEHILITVLAPDAWSGAQLWGESVGQWPVLTVPGTSRYAFILSVERLSAALNELPNEGAAVEHVYDY